MRRNYSRAQRFEQRQDARNAVLYIALTIAAILGILFFGIPAIGKVAGFLHDLRSSGTPIDSKDTTPPAPPVLETLPESTNKTAIEVFGHTEAGARVTLSVNDKDEEVIADVSGSFSYEWTLWKGENKIKAKSKDTAGNESAVTQTIVVIFDNTPPDLNINNPANGTEFRGTKERQINISGSTEARSSVTINDRIVAVDTDGKFSFFTTLTDGDNTFVTKSKDAAGNEVEKSITVHFTP